LGTIPAPNIADEAGQIAAAPQNALAEYARVAALKQQTAQSAAATQGQQLENQQRQAQLNDSQAMTKAMQSWDGKDLNDLLTGAKKSGISAPGYMGLQKNIIDQKTNLNKLSDEDFSHQQKIADLTQGVHDQVSQAPPEQKQDVYARGLATLRQNGIDVSNEPPQYPGDDVFAQHLPAIRLHSALVAESDKDREVSAQEAKARSENATAAHQEFINKLTENSKPGDFDTQIDGMLDPKGSTAEQLQNHFVKSQVNASLSRGDLDGAKKFIDQAYESKLAVNKDIAINTNPDIQRGKVEVAKNTAQAKADVQNGGRILIPAGATGEDALANLDPTTAAAIRMIGDGKADFATFASRSTLAGKKELAAAVAAYNPNFDQNTFKVRGKEQTAFTSGSQGQQLTAIGTARNHMQTFKDTADALDNGNLLKANQFGNYLGMQFGSDKATNFNIARSAFAGEVGKAFAGANVGVQDRQELIDKINAASSPAQLKGYADTADALLAGKQKSLKESYDQGIQGKPNFGGSSTHSSSPTNLSVKAPNGKTYTFKDQSSLDAFKKAAGIQ
jgi:hypothetical protein